ncbi:hypothetical protein [Streptomyces sp. CoH27]|uniref:hypothetical protein n=1 Tax=Streptomyces sp. CoH27 TaxID=2875763 RepID=UPI0035A88559
MQATEDIDGQVELGESEVQFPAQEHAAMVGRARLLVARSGFHGARSWMRPVTATGRARRTTRQKPPSCSGRGWRESRKARWSSATTTT